jgi:iron complex transport system permease protein
MFVLGVSIGSTSIPFRFVLSSIYDQFAKTHHTPIDIQTIIIGIRIPRVLLAFLVGTSLSLAGATFQGVLKNPLADPFTLGVSSGASVGAVIVIFFQITFPFFSSFTLPIVSIIAGFLTLLFLLYFVSKLNNNLNVESIILGGIIISSFCSALLSFIISLSNNELRAVMGWLMGSLGSRGYSYSLLLLPFLIVGGIFIISVSRQLDALTFGQTSAQHLGVNVKKITYLLLFTASCLTGAAVAVSGAIGFVGLVVPHFTRKLVGPLHRHLLILTMLHGGIFLMGTDLISRTILAPSELPVGVVTSLIGAPIFALILIRMKKRGVKN